ncbi:MAG: glycosyltransferase family 2 protein [Lachnospiraceae bacterium]|nr:glycosyltransferase family 2 protein [Lachnospiraceae bacterium]
MVNILYCIKSFLGRYCSLDEIYNMDIYFEKFIVNYYKLMPRKRSGVCDRITQRKLIISMTTIPDRVDKVWITIESLLRQTYKPDQIILWLARDEFATVELPEQLRRQIKRGLTISYCDNLKSYKKFYYTMKENPNAYVITVDDDVIYAETMVKTLVKAYMDNWGKVICNRSHMIKKRNGKCASYNNWLKYEDRGKIRCEATYANFFTGCAGVFFPVFLMDKRILEKEIFTSIAPTADDVWLNFICWVSKVKIKNTEGILGNVININESSGKGLALQNVNKRKNDSQIRAVLEYLNVNLDDYI